MKNFVQFQTNLVERLTSNFERLQSLVTSQIKPLAVFRVRTEPESAQSWKAMGCRSKRASL